MKTIVKGLLHRLGVEVRRYNTNLLDKALVSMNAKKPSKGNILVSYIVEPLLAQNIEIDFNSHTHYWESTQIAKIFLEKGYNVDVIDYRNTTFIPLKKYSFFVGARTNFERICKSINTDCVKIVHLDTAHWAFNNHASYTRLKQLISRRGFSIRGSLRVIEENSAIEHADYATILGNRFTEGTYSFSKKPICRIPISTCATYPWDENKDFKSCSKNFLWFGSAGAVHRGLDMLLEIFAEMPDYQLYICGPLEQEKEFVKFYNLELYNKPNIHMLGWVNVQDQQFLQIIKKCCAIVFPSCAEGGGGSVINCMHAGLIPVVSYESSVDVRSDYGYILKSSSKNEIQKAIEVVAGLPPDKLKEMSKKSWDFARSNHTRENFNEKFKAVVQDLCN